MKSELHSTKSRPARFPMDSLPEGPRGLYTDHPNAVMSALTIIGGAVGPSARVRRITTQESFCPQMLLVIRADNGQPEWLPGLLGPIQEYQRQLLASNSLEFDPKALITKEAQIKSDRNAFFRNDHFPDKAHVGYFDGQLHRIAFQRKHWFYSEHPTPGTIRDLCGQSADEGMLLAWTRPRSFFDHVSFLNTAGGRHEGDFILRTLSGEPFIQPRDEGELILERPCLNGIAVCSLADLKSLIAGDYELFLTFWR